MLTDGFCLTTDLSDLTSEGFTASLPTDEETGLLVAEEPLVLLTGLPVWSDPPETYLSLLEEAVDGIILLL